MSANLKYALFDFFEENCVEVGESVWIVEDDLGLTLPPFDDTWDTEELVTVEWKKGSKRNAGKTFPAKVIRFSGN